MLDKRVKDLVEVVIMNMMKNNGYSRDMAMETIIYSLSNGIVDFSEIIV